MMMAESVGGTPQGSPSKDRHVVTVTGRSLRQLLQESYTKLSQLEELVFEVRLLLGRMKVCVCVCGWELELDLRS
jgi:hypothetical protein